MQHFTEELSSETLANLLDKTIRKIPGLDVSQTELTSVNENAANIIRGITISETIKGQVNCTAHTLQLVIKDCIDSDATINHIITKCQAVAAMTHGSSKQANQIKDMCERLDKDPSQTQKWPYRVIILPEGIRGDSMYLCMDSILNLKEPLLQLRAEDAAFKDAPSEQDFETMSELENLLKAFRVGIVELSAESIPTLHNVIVIIYNLTMKLTEASKNSKCDHVKAWANQGLIAMEERFPKCGAGNKEFALGNFFHPFYRGLIAEKKNDDFNIWIEQMIMSSTPTVRHPKYLINF